MTALNDTENTSITMIIMNNFTQLKVDLRQPARFK